MQVLVDTCIWSLVLRHKENNQTHFINELAEIVKEHRVQIIGPIRQEILSGIKIKQQFDKLKDYLIAFPDFHLSRQDYEYAAELYNSLRSQGIQGSNTDFLICAVSIRYQMSIFTIDQDFEFFARYIPIKLHKILNH